MSSGTCPTFPLESVRATPQVMVLQDPDPQQKRRRKRTKDSDSSPGSDSKSDESDSDDSDQGDDNDSDGRDDFDTGQPSSSTSSLLQSAEGRAWLSNLFFGDGSDDPENAIDELIQEGFEMNKQNSSLPADIQDLEAEEESFAREAAEESGLDLVAARETAMIQKDCEKLKAQIQSQSVSPVVEANIAASIADQIRGGMMPEEAAEEAMLNQESMLGNVSIEHVGANASAESGAANPASLPRPMQFETAFSHWFDQCLTSLQALLDRKQALETRSVGEKGELSLVHGHIQGAKASSEDSKEIQESIFWVHWREAERRSGRPASLDKENRVVCIVATGALREPRDYSAASVIHPAIGVRMERTRGYRGGLRPQVPQNVIRLRDMWQAALVARDSDSSLTFGATDLDGSFGECFICNTGAGEALVAEGVAADVVSKCSLCLLPYHGRCASEILDHVSKSADMANFSCPEDVDIAALDPPDVFTSIDGGRGSTRTSGCMYWLSVAVFVFSVLSLQLCTLAKD